MKDSELDLAMVNTCQVHVKYFINQDQQRRNEEEKIWFK